MNQKIEISSKTIIFTVFFLISLKALWLIRELIYALFLAFIFMSALKPPVNYLEKKIFPRSLAVFFVFLTTVVIVLFTGSFVIPPLVRESLAFFKSLPDLITNSFSTPSSYLNLEPLTSFLPDLTKNFVKFISGVFSNFIFFLSTVVFTFYFLLEEKFLKKILEKFLEEKQAEKIVAISDNVERRMGMWVWGELILMTVIGIMSYGGLSLLRIKYVLPLAIIAGILEIVPIIGPTISTIPAFFVAASNSWFLGLSVIALYFLIQQLENNLIVPLVMKKAVGLNPVVTLIALTIGGKLGGFLGIFLSVPAALLLETILIELIKTRRL